MSAQLCVVRPGALTTVQDLGRWGYQRFGVPVSEFDTVNAGFTFERTRILIDASAPQRYIDFVNEFGEDTNTFRTNLSYSRDSRDSLTWPTKGWLNEVGAEIGIPPGDLKYYRLNYQSQAFYTPSRLPWLTFMANGELGYANGYGGKPLPFFKNFYAGGVGSVRARAVRRLGSAVLYLAWLACGRLDGYWELRLGPWDVAAGSLMVEEAGGRITNLSGGALELDKPALVATNGRIHSAVLDVLREVRGAKP